MASVVQISIQVDSATAQSALTDIAAKLQQVGIQGSASLSQAGNAANQMNGHITTSLDGVRLLSQEFGLKLPRALESMLSRIPAVSSAIGGMVGGFAVIAGIEVFSRAIEGATELYSKLFDVTSQLDKYHAKAAETATQNLIDNASLETSRAILAQATQDVERLQSKLEASGAKGPLGGLTSYLSQIGAAEGQVNDSGAVAPNYSKDDQEKQLRAEENKQASALKTNQLEQEGILKTLEAQKQYDSEALAGGNRIKAVEADQIAIAKEKQQYLQQQEETYANIVKLNNQLADLYPSHYKRQESFTPSPNAGQSEYDSAASSAALEASAARINLARQEHDETMQLRAEALSAGLQGEAKYEQERESAIARIADKFKQGELSSQAAIQRTAALNQKFDGEKEQRMQALYAEAMKMEADSQSAGLTGVAKVIAEQSAAIQAVNEAERKSTGGAPENQTQAIAFQIERVAAHQKATQQITEIETSFAQDMDQITQEAARSGLSGYAAIAAESAEKVSEIRKKFDQQFGSADLSNPDTLSAYVVAESKMQDAITAVDGDGDRKRQDLQRQNAAQTQEIEDQANETVLQTHRDGLAGILAQEDQQTQKLQMEYDRRVTALNQALAKGDISTEDAARRQAAYYQQMNAQIENEELQARDQIAGTLQSFFSDPSKAIQNAAEKMMFQILANWVMQLNIFKGQAGGILSDLFGGGGVSVPGHGSGGIWSEISGAGHNAPSSDPASMPQFAQLQQAAAEQDAAATEQTSATTQFGSSTVQFGGSVVQFGAIVSQMSASSSGGGLGGLGGIGDGDLSESDSEGLDAAGALSTSTPTQANELSSLFNASDVSGGSSALASFSSSADPAAQLQAATNQMMAGEGNSALALQQNSGSTLGTDLGAAGAIGGGAFGLYSALTNAYNNNSPGMGALSGALSGASLGAGIGTMILPGLGTLIGAGIGAIGGALAGLFAGLFGESKHSKAKKYITRTLEPQVDALVKKYYAGQSDYESSSRALISFGAQSKSSLEQQFGSSAGDDEYNAVLVPYMNKARSEMEQSEAAGRSNIPEGTAQFHMGGLITGFGPLATSTSEGYIHAMMGERVMNPAASAAYGSVLDAMNSGTFSSNARRMISNSQRGSSVMRPAGGSATSVQLTVQAIDAKSFESWLLQGGARIINRQLNQLQGGYAGSADA